MYVSRSCSRRVKVSVKRSLCVSSHLFGGSLLGEQCDSFAGCDQPCVQ